MNYSRGGIGAIDAANPALSAPGRMTNTTSAAPMQAPGRMTNTIAPTTPKGPVVGPGMGGAPAGYRNPPTTNWRGPARGPGVAGTLSPREQSWEDARKFNEQQDEAKRQFDLQRQDQLARENAASRNAANTVRQPSGGGSYNSPSTAIDGIYNAAPVASSSSNEPDQRETWAHEGDVDSRHHQWNLDDEQRWKDYIGTLTGKFDSPGQAGGATGPDPNEAAARAAAFARAKEQAGSTARAGLDSLYDVMASTGRSGSAVEAGAAGQVAAGTAGDLNDFTREQYIQDLDRSREVSDRNYQGDLTKRGQNMGWLQSLLGLLGSRKNLY